MDFLKRYFSKEWFFSPLFIGGSLKTGLFFNIFAFLIIIPISNYFLSGEFSYNLLFGNSLLGFVFSVIFWLSFACFFLSIIPFARDFEEETKNKD